METGLTIIKRKDRFGDNIFGLQNSYTKKIVIPCRFSEIYCFSEGLACVRDYYHYGYINAKGEEVIPLTLDYATSFHNLKAFVYQNGKYCYIDHQGYEVILSNHELDFLFDQAKDIIAQNTMPVSISYLQRILHIGYQRACCIVEQLYIKQMIPPHKDILLRNNFRVKSYY